MSAKFNDYRLFSGGFWLRSIFFSFFIIIILIIAAFPDNSRGQNDKNNLPIIDGVIEDSEYDFSASFSGGDFKVYWTVENDTITFGITAKTSGWIALGFGKSMRSADMIIGWVDDTGNVTLLDSHGTNVRRDHPPDVDEGGTDDILLASGTESSGWTVIEFSRKLVTGDDKDVSLSESGKTDIIWAYGTTEEFTDQHSERGLGVLNLGSGESEEKDEIRWPLHASLMISAFVLLLIGVIIARTQRSKSWWLKTHRNINSIAVILAIFGLVIAIGMVQESTGEHFGAPHAYFSVITLIFIIVTPIMGASKPKEKEKLEQIRYLHKRWGRVTLALMIFNILSGFLTAYGYI